MHKVTLLALAASSLVTGCATYTPPDYLQTAVKPGDHLVLTQPVDREPFNRAVYFQEGKARNWLGGTVWFTECRAILGQEAPDAKLSEGEYAVTDVVSHEYATSIDSLSVSTRLSLRTISGVPLEAVSCERWVDLGEVMREADGITVANFREAVGDYMRFQPAL